MALLPDFRDEEVRQRVAIAKPEHEVGKRLSGEVSLIEVMSVKRIDVFDLGMDPLKLIPGFDASACL